MTRWHWAHHKYKLITCRNCDGRGFFYGPTGSHYDVRCMSCGGTGRVMVPNDYTEQEPRS